MAQTGEIILSELKAYYRLEDIRLVDKNKVDQANEKRLYYEICQGIGLGFLGNIFNNFNYPCLFTTIVFIGAGIFFLMRYLRSYHGISTIRFPDKEGNL